MRSEGREELVSRLLENSILTVKDQLELLREANYSQGIEHTSLLFVFKDAQNR